MSATALPAPARRHYRLSSPQLSLGDELATFELNRLPDEVARYLTAVDEYRRAGSAPEWRSELAELTCRGLV